MLDSEELTVRAGRPPSARIALMLFATAQYAESEESILHQLSQSDARTIDSAPYSKLEDAAGADAEELVSFEPLLVPEDAEPEDELLLETVFGIEAVASTVATHSEET